MKREFKYCLLGYDWLTAVSRRGQEGMAYGVNCVKDIGHNLHSKNFTAISSHSKRLQAFYNLLYVIAFPVAAGEASPAFLQ